VDSLVIVMSCVKVVDLAEVKPAACCSPTDQRFMLPTSPSLDVCQILLFYLLHLIFG